MEFMQKTMTLQAYQDSWVWIIVMSAVVVGLVFVALALTLWVFRRTAAKKKFCCGRKGCAKCRGCEYPAGLNERTEEDNAHARCKVTQDRIWTGFCVAFGVAVSLCFIFSVSGGIMIHRCAQTKDIVAEERAETRDAWFALTQDDTRLCRNCGEIAGKGERYCKSCGGYLCGDATVCPECEKVITEENTSFCPKCGAALNEE